MQATPDVVERSAELRQRVGLLVDVPELDPTRAHQRQQLVALPVDAGVTDGTAGVVVDSEVDRHRRSIGVDPRDVEAETNRLELLAIQ